MQDDADLSASKMINELYVRESAFTPRRAALLLRIG